MTDSRANEISGAMAKNGELYVLDMGKPVKILDFAEEMIRPGTENGAAGGEGGGDAAVFHFGIVFFALLGKAGEDRRDQDPEPRPSR